MVGSSLSFITETVEETQDRGVSGAVAGTSGRGVPGVSGSGGVLLLSCVPLVGVDILKKLLELNRFSIPGREEE